MIGERLAHKPHPALTELIQERKTPFSQFFSPQQLISLCDEEYTRVHQHLENKEPLLFRNPEFSLCVERYNQMRNQILSRESTHRDELTQLAIDVISEIYDIPEGQINWTADFNLEGMIDPSADQDTEDLDISPDRLPFLSAEIEKRVLLNSLVHGSSVHIWKSCHHIVSPELRELSPILPTLYDVYTAVLGYMMWQATPQMFEQAMAEGLLIGQGINQIEFGEDEEINISVEAINFPAMLHEVNKAALDLVICHGLPEDVTEDELKYIYAKADRYEDEFWHYLVSPSLWTRFIEAEKKPTTELPDVLMDLATKTPEMVKYEFERLCQHR